MSVEKRKAIAGMGGKSAHAGGLAHKWTKEEASLAGKIGGKKKKHRKHKEKSY